METNARQWPTIKQAAARELSESGSDANVVDGIVGGALQFQWPSPATASPLHFARLVDCLSSAAGFAHGGAAHRARY